MSEDPIEYFSSRAPFILGYKRVLFINTSTKNMLEQVVRENLEQIKEYFHRKGFEFVYLPDYVSHINLKDPIQREYFLYTYPYLLNEAEVLYKGLESDPYDLVREVMGLPDDATPCLYFNDGRKVQSVKVDSLFTLYNFVDELMRARNPTILFSKSKPLINKEPESAYNEELFDKVDGEVVKYIRGIEDLDAIKLLINILSAKLSDKVDSKLSRLLVDERHRVRLIDYGDIEIQLTPLQKAVYLFFLKHPEGIMFNSVYEHRVELLSIYLSITNRDDMDQLKASIDDLVDPLSNSLSEKCSKIRSAFLSRIMNHWPATTTLMG